MKMEAHWPSKSLQRQNWKDDGTFLAPSMKVLLAVKATIKMGWARILADWILTLFSCLTEWLESYVSLYSSRSWGLQNDLDRTLWKTKPVCCGLEHVFDGRTNWSHWNQISFSECNERVHWRLVSTGRGHDWHRLSVWQLKRDGYLPYKATPWAFERSGGSTTSPVISISIDANTRH